VTGERSRLRHRRVGASCSIESRPLREFLAATHPFASLDRVVGMTATPTSTKTASTFRMQCSVEISIRAAPEHIWALLTDAVKFPSWNSTVTRVDGTIARGQKLALQVPAAPGRVFKPTVAAFEANRRMVWKDGSRRCSPGCARSRSSRAATARCS
jgi:hypothetical protein